MSRHFQPQPNLASQLQSINLPPAKQIPKNVFTPNNVQRNYLPPKPQYLTPQLQHNFSSQRPAINLPQTKQVSTNVFTPNNIPRNNLPTGTQSSAYNHFSSASKKIIFLRPL